MRLGHLPAAIDARGDHDTAVALRRLDKHLDDLEQTFAKIGFRNNQVTETFIQQISDKLFATVNIFGVVPAKDYLHFIDTDPQETVLGGVDETGARLFLGTSAPAASDSNAQTDYALTFVAPAGASASGTGIEGLWKFGVSDASLSTNYFAFINAVSADAAWIPTFIARSTYVDGALTFQYDTAGSWSGAGLIRAGINFHVVDSGLASKAVTSTARPAFAFINGDPPTAGAAVLADVSVEGDWKFYNRSFQSTAAYTSILDGAGAAGQFAPTLRLQSGGISGFGGAMVGAIPTGLDAPAADLAAVVLDGRRSNDTALSSADILVIRNFGTTLAKMNVGGGMTFVTGVSSTFSATFNKETIHNGGVDLGTSGRVDSNVADAASAVQFLLKPTTTLTSSTDRSIFAIKTAADAFLMSLRSDGTFDFNAGGVVGGYFNIGGTLGSGINNGITFTPTMNGSGAAFASAAYQNVLMGASFKTVLPTTPNGANYVGGVFMTGHPSSLTANVNSEWAGWFRPSDSASALNSGRTWVEMGGWKVFGTAQSKNFGTITDWYGGYVSDSKAAALGVGEAITNARGIYLEEQTRAGTINNGIFLATATAGYKAIAIRDQGAYLASGAASEIDIHGDAAVDLNIGTTQKVRLTTSLLQVNAGVDTRLKGTLFMDTMSTITSDDTAVQFFFVSSFNSASAVPQFIFQASGTASRHTEWRDSSSSNIMHLAQTGALTVTGNIAANGGITMGDADDIVVNTVTGTKIATAAAQKLGFYGATPVIQRADAGALTDNTTGTIDGTLVDVGAIFSQANINNNFADCADRINKIRTALRDVGIMA